MESVLATQPSASHRILVIDDEVLNTQIFSRILQHEGHKVETATDPHKGLARLEEGEFDLVFTDLGMAGMNGWEVAEIAKKINPQTQVALVTGWGAEFDEEKLVRHGVDWVLAKPVKKDDFLRVIAECGHRQNRGGLTH